MPAIVDTLPASETRRRLGEQWLERNRAAIEAYNARIEREGTFSEQIAQWLQETTRDG